MNYIYGQPVRRRRINWTPFFVFVWALDIAIIYLLWSGKICWFLLMLP